MTTQHHNEPTVPTQEPTPPAGQPNTHRTPRTLLALFILAIGGMGYALYYNTQTQTALQQQTHELRAQIDALKTQYTTTAEQLIQTQDALSQSRDTLKNQLQTLGETLQTALQQQNYTHQDWALFKARYYLELAQINTRWSADRSTSITLLQQADQLLSQLADPRLLSIRQAIAEEKAQLETAATLDTTGLLSQLDALQHLLTQAPFRQSPSPAPDTQPHTKPTTEATSWRNHLKNNLQHLEKLITVRHYDQPIQPRPNAAQETALREGIRFNLQAMQWAVLQQNETAYQLFLTQAQTTIQQFLDPTQPVTQRVLQQLHTLQQKKWLPLPIPEQALTLMNQLITAHTDSPPPPSTREQEEINP